MSKLATVCILLVSSILVSGQVARALEMCRGKMKFPSISQVSLKPLKGGETGIEATIVMMSSHHISVRWRSGTKEAKEDDDNFRYWSDGSGNQQNLYVKLKLPDYTTDSRVNAIGRAIVVTMTIDYPCRPVVLEGTLGSFEEMERVLLRSMTGLPKRSYVTDNEGYQELKLLFSDRPYNSNTGRYVTLAPVCLTLFQRENGELSVKNGYIRGKVQAVSEHIEITCLIPNHDVIESQVINMITGFKGSGMEVNMTMTAELRRTNLDIPAVMVLNSELGVPTMTDGTLVIHAEAVQGNTSFYCVADAAVKPNLTASQPGQSHLKPELTTNNFINYRMARYIVPNPRSGESVEYVCLAKNGNKDARQPFQLVGKVPVKLKEITTKVIYAKDLVDGGNNQVNLTCEATGSPGPVYIKIYSNLGPFPWPVNARDFIARYRVKQVQSSGMSNNYRVSRTVDGNKTTATLVINDVKTVVDNLATNYWSTHSVLEYFCFAYNSDGLDLEWLLNIYE